MPLLAENLTSLVSDVLQDLDEGKFTQLMQSAQDYPLYRRFLRGEEGDVLVAGERTANGRAIRVNLANRLGTGATMDELFGVDAPIVQDHTANVVVPFRLAKDSWGYDVREQALMGTDARQILDYIRIREYATRIRMTELAETQLHTLPTTTTTTDTWGVPYWVTLYNDATYTTQATQEGFTGENPVDAAQDAIAALAEVGGIDATATANENWRNYSGLFSGLPDGDFGVARMIRRAFARVKFRSPFEMSGDKVASVDENPFLILMPLATIELMEQFAKGQNQQLGFNIAPATGRTNFMGLELTWDPQLDTAVGTNGTRTSQNHIVYMLNTRHLYARILRDNFFRRTGPFMAPNQHNVYLVYLDLAWNLVCDNRRAQAALHGSISLV